MVNLCAVYRTPKDNGAYDILPCGLGIPICIHQDGDVFLLEPI